MRERLRATRSAFGALLAVILFTATGCGGGARPAPPLGAQEVAIDTVDGETLSAVVVGTGPIGVVVVHGANASRVNWYEAGGRIAAEGGLTVVLLDLRGYGTSTGERRTHQDLDIEAAMGWVRRQPGVERVALVGSSMGATAVLAVAGGRPDSVAGVVALSPPAVSGLDALSAAPNLVMPLLLAAADGDTTYAASTREIATAAGTEAVIVTGDGHGTGMFDDHPELVDRIAAFLGSL